MAIFYVYMKCCPKHSPNNVYNPRILICESRYVADEFFRALQDAQRSQGNRLADYEGNWYRYLERRTPQLWYYESIGDPNILSWPALEEFQTSVIFQPLGRGDILPIIPIVDEPDWVHNGTYFIRNKRQQNQYWCVFSAGSIFISETKKTKFRICGTRFGANDRKVLIRSDPVAIYFPDALPTVAYVAAAQDKSLFVTTGRTEWKFGDLLGGFKMSCSGTSAGGNVRWADKGDGDEWELC